MKPVHFVGSSREDLRGLLDDARETAGHQLFKVQQGKAPDDWKPIPTVGAGVNEIRVWEESGTWPSLKRQSMYCMSSKNGLRRPRKAIFS
jgi:phage-related protein